MADPLLTDTSRPHVTLPASSPDRNGFGARLPAPLSSFVGREHEIATVCALLRREDVRLLTLTGPGGVGKSRLALRVATEMTGDFPNGIVYVALAPISDPSLVLPTIAQAVGMPEASERTLPERLARLLAGQRILLVLDNFEQVVEEAGSVAALLEASPEPKALITSRVALRVGGEQEFAVPPLSLPVVGSAAPLELAPNPAMTLFVQRALSVKSDFALTEANAEAVAEICCRVDGLPLAIELAAARSKVLSPPALLARLSHGLEVLTGGPRDQPTRLQTMRDAIGWSHDLLSDAEQVVFRRLAVFAGGFTLDAAEAICADQSPIAASSVLDDLAALVDSSLLRQVDRADGETPPSRGRWPGGPEGESWFEMLETIREYGLEQLAASGEVELTRTRHAAWCLNLAESAWPAFASRTNQVQWLDRLEAEHDNFRGALAWLEAIGDIEPALRICGRLFWFWYVRGYLSEGRAWLERVLEQAKDAPKDARAQALFGLAMLTHYQGDDECAVPCLEESLSLWNELDDDWGTSVTLTGLGVVAEDNGSFARAVPFLEQGLGRARAAGDRTNIALALDHLGVVAWGQGDAETAVPYWQEALEFHRAINDTWGASISLSYLGMVACERGDFATSDEMLRESLQMRWALGTKEDIAHGLANFGALAAAQGYFVRAARLFAAAEAIQEAIGNLLKEPERTFYEGAITLARDRLDEQAFAMSWAAGRALRLEDAVAEALATPPEAESQDEPLEGLPKVAPFGLTERELQLLPLLVAGESDRQIGESLFISPRTAQKHVANICAKLGVSTRTAAATAAIRAGIVPGEQPPSPPPNTPH